MKAILHVCDNILGKVWKNDFAGDGRHRAMSSNSQKLVHKHHKKSFKHIYFPSDMQCSCNSKVSFVEIKVPMQATSPRCRLHGSTIKIRSGYATSRLHSSCVASWVVGVSMLLWCQIFRRCRVIEIINCWMWDIAWYMVPPHVPDCVQEGRTCRMLQTATLSTPSDFSMKSFKKLL